MRPILVAMAVDKEKLQEEFEKRVKAVKEEDAQKVVDNATQIVGKVERSGVLKRELAKVRLLLMMVEDYLDGEYREVPWFTIAAAVVALLYILSPVDLIPDFIPVIGLTDDLAMLLLVWTLISEDICRYAHWKAQRDQEAARLYRRACAD